MTTSEIFSMLYSILTADDKSAATLEYMRAELPDGARLYFVTDGHYTYRYTTLVEAKKAFKLGYGNELYAVDKYGDSYTIARKA